ncbi:amidohydrolase family protein [Sphingomonas azotifigens]|uniref:amidohydrolase family protein n=1 Tax=Sphingomonas azotifigens TaxID=330920 RepID=UPI000A006281|nr:amidohydrolase family protein [Sphingomonas azotifigens]
MRHLRLALLLAAAVVPPAAAQTQKADLLTPPSDARHFTISSTAGKHGDVWSWTLPDGRIAYRMSMSLRGWVTETDEVVRLGPDQRPTELAVRGFTDSGDATENFSVDPGGIAHWKTVVDSGEKPFGSARYNSYGGPWLAGELDINALVAAGPAGLDLLPSGHASIAIGAPVEIDGPGGKKVVKLAQISGLGFSPSPVWLDAQNHYFGSAGVLALLPAGFEAAGPKLKEIQDKAAADMVREVAHSFLAPANRTPTLIAHVLVFDSVGGRYLPDQSVLIADGKVAKLGPASSIRAAKDVTVIDGHGRTLLPGLWDSHQHVGDDWNLLQNVATGITNYRSPGSSIEDAQSIFKRRAAGDLLAPDGKVSVIIDKKDPLAAQMALTVSSEAEAIAAVRKVKAAGMWGVKFYTSMDPAWIAPAAAEAHRLGMHVHGHVPAHMRPLDAVRAGYDEVTHINFILMQGMPQAVVDKANTAARLEGPAQYGKDLNLDAPEWRAFYAELARRKTIIDPTLSTWEPLMTSDGSAVPLDYAAYADIAPPAVARGWKIGGYPLFGGLTRDDFRKSFDKMVEVVGRLHQAGVPIVAGTDGYGLEIVRELELYEKAGLTNVEALQTATIVPARMVGMADRVGAIAPGKTADILLVEGDVSKDIGNLRHVRTVFLDGYRLDGDALRKASGLSGMPK